MIRISKMADYAVVLLSVMARENGAVMSASMLAQVTKLPEPTVSKIMKILGKSGIVTATRGINGGYALSTVPQAIDIGRIIRAIDGPVAITSCTDRQDTDCSLTDICSVHGRWDDVNTAIVQALENVKLSDMALRSIRPNNKKIRDGVAYGRH